MKNRRNLNPFRNELRNRCILVSRFVPYSAMAVYPFIFIKKEAMRNDALLIHHEKIHHRQQIELLIVPFYLFYFLHYLFNLFRYRKHDTAYRQIIFEREAFAMENDFDYLKKRKWFAFMKF